MVIRMTVRRHRMNRRAFVSLYVIGAFVLLALFFVWGIARNWSCRPNRQPRPPVSRVYEVVTVLSGAQIEVQYGRKDRRKTTVTLADIDASKWPEEAQKHLASICGPTIRVETPRHGLLRGTPDDADSSRQEGDGNGELLPDDDQGGSDTIAARGPIVGLVYGQSGACLNIAQVADGFAVCGPEAPKAWKKQESSARKSKAGMWRSK
jgi:hypothetical protein